MNEKNKRYSATVLEVGLPTSIVRGPAKRKPYFQHKILHSFGMNVQNIVGPFTRGS